jgi:GntR family transcriptional repressor for pyruvate dehydrogenase complex
MVLPADKPERPGGRLLGVEKVPTFNRNSVTADVVRSVLQLIADLELEPGTRLPSERQLSEALGVGRSSVREAVKTLTLLGLIDVRHGDGMYLRSNDLDVLSALVEWGLMLHQRRVIDLAEARRHLEVAAAGLAATRRGDGELADMRAAVDRMVVAAAQGDKQAMVVADIAFHRGVAAASKNVVIADILSSAESLLGVWITRVLDKFGLDDQTHLEHDEILAAIERGDRAEAEDTMRRHMERGFQRLEATLSDS